MTNHSCIILWTWKQHNVTSLYTNTLVKH